MDPLLPSLPAHLEPTEGDGGIKDVEAVDPDGPLPQSPGQGVGGVEVVGEDPSSKPIAGGICPANHLIKVSGWRWHGTERVRT